jgi:hypothetical protein
MNKSAKALADIFENLPEQEQKTLLDFAEFLKSRAPAAQPKSIDSETADIPRPDNESVIAAIKRLTETYPMIDRTSMFNETSDLMMQHTMTGRAATEVIDEMEILFERKLQQILEDFE